MEKLLIPWVGQKKYKMSLEYLVPKASYFSENDGEMSKGQLARLKELPTV